MKGPKGISLAIGLTAILWLALPALADETSGAWRDTDQPNCQAWNPDPHPEETATWSGSCRNGKADGIGKLTWSYVDDGGKQVTQIEQGQLDLGKKAAWMDTDRPDCLVGNHIGLVFNVMWTGRCQGGKAAGPGKLTFSAWSDNVQFTGVFEGSYKAGQMDGRGVLSYVEKGIRIEGVFKDDLLEGHGRMTSPDFSFEGEFKAGLRDGQGVYITSKGYRYEGQFRKGVYNGQGVQILRDGARYEGQFKDGEWDGYGVLIYADGSRYEGHFNKKNRTGLGRLMFADGTSYQGNFENGVPHGIGECTDPDGKPGRCEYSRGAFVRWLE